MRNFNLPLHDDHSNPHMLNLNIADYFTVQATPNGKNPINLGDMHDQDLNKTTQLIKIEDNMDEEANSALNNSQFPMPQEQNSPEDDEEE